MHGSGWRGVVSLAVFSLRTALDAVGHNRLRAALTSLGILFGVASVIAMLAIGHGAEQEILNQMKLLGTNNVVVTPIVRQEEGQAKDAGDKKEVRRFTPGLTYADALALRTLPAIDAVTAEIVVNSLFTREGRRRSGKLVGVDTPYFRLLNLPLAEGRYFSPEAVRNEAAVAIIGQGVRTRFFTSENPIGKQLKVGGVWVTVVGVLEDRQVSSEAHDRLGIRDANMDVYVPATTMLRRFRDRAKVTAADLEKAARGYEVVSTSDSTQETEEQRAEKRNYNQLDRVIVRVNDSRLMGGIANVAQRMLTRRHNAVVDFEVTVPELLLKQERRTKTIFNVVLGAIASISLLVGGIGIMNIMLASVLERIHEIGVRRAVGATQRNVLAQFLTEAVLISVVGGAAGIAIGVVLSRAIQHVANIHTLVSPVSVALAFGVSCAVGLVFGIVPAQRAAAQDPIDCLRYE